MRRYSISSVLLFIVFTLLACRPTATPQLTRTRSAEMPTSTATLGPTATLKNPITEIAPTAAPLWRTYLPTVSFEDSMAFVSDRIVTNGDCELPCVWGIVPGKTSKDEFLQELGPYGAINEYERLDGSTLYTFYIPESYDSPDFKKPIEIKFISRNEIVEEISLHGVLFGESFSKISSILDELGEPDEIYAGIYPQPIFQIGDYEIFLLYLKQKLSIEIHSDLAIHNSENVMCPQSISGRTAYGPVFHLWSFPNETDLYLIEDITHIPQLISNNPEYSPNVFYETYRNQDTTECIQTGFFIDE